MEVAVGKDEKKLIALLKKTGAQDVSVHLKEEEA
jgi:hypothetical protein